MFNTFSTLQNALVVVQLKHAPFRADPDVCDAVAELHKAVVKAIEDMVLALEKSLCKGALRARGCWDVYIVLQLTELLVQGPDLRTS